MNAAVRFMLLSVLGVLILQPARLYADGGTMRLSQRVEGYQITVFTAPTPPRAGPVDVSVFVQDADTGEPAGDVDVTVQAVPSNKPEQAVRYPATAAAATNKLFRSAVFELPEPGSWQILVTLDGERGQTEMRFEVEVADRPPSWQATAPWIGWPALAVVLFAVHRMLVRRKARSDAPKASRSRGDRPGLRTENSRQEVVRRENVILAKIAGE